MFEYAISKHAMMRLSQRGVRDEDIDLIQRCGTQIGPAEWFMKRSDAEREIEEMKRMFRRLERTSKNMKQRFERALKRRIQQLDRLKGLKVVVAGYTVITCYWPSAAYQRRARCRGRRGRI